MRLLMRATVDAFHTYALAMASDSLISRGIDFEQLTRQQQEQECERTSVPLQRFHRWLREDMLSICVTDISATVQ